MKMKTYVNKTSREQIKKAIAVFLSLTLFFEIVAPTCAYALTGGPSQPEVQGFEPIGTSDMVDLFSGDFTYNIPLLDIDGYPINISYNGGITMDQEASWVGLGWNINPGVVNRAMRGMPDDFNGDEVVKEFNMKPNSTFGMSAGFGAELFGDTSLSISGHASVGINFNNYNGIGIEKSINASIGAGDKTKFPLGGSLGLTSSSSNGLSVQPSVSFSRKISDVNKSEYKSLSATLGASFNSRMGLSQLSFGTTVERNQHRTATNQSDQTVASGSMVGGSFDLGMPTYTPSSDLPMNNFSVNASFKFGGELFGLTGTFDISGYYSVQKLRESSRSNPAFGYMNSEAGQTNENALLDFNRENEGAFMPTTPALSLSNYTYDIFSVNGQGVGGSYRPYRSDVGHIFDPYTETTSNSGSIGVELAAGMLYKGGVDINVTHVESNSGDWTDNNEAGQKLRYGGTPLNSTHEKFYFKEANEKSVQTDNSFFAQMGGADPVRFNLVEESKFNTYADDRFVNHNNGHIQINTNTRNGREKRNQVISTITRAELENGLGIDTVHSNAYTLAPKHHIAEITSTATDGRRYVYGIAAYNKTQLEISFAVGAQRNSNNGLNGDCLTGLVEYGSFDGGDDNSLGNKRGLDNYYSSTKMPAYAHSYLLTSVLSADYVDADNEKGPSAGDLGTWVKFNYTKIDNYKWRTPVGDHKANYNEGLKTDPNDDKASIIYGEKELWYVSSIETKNYIAIFELGDRLDGYGVLDKEGKVNTSGPTMQYLKKITLYSKPDFIKNGTNATPLKEVHFEYDYSLCPNAANNKHYVDGTSTDPTLTGKLTLKRIFFTYQNSNKAKFSPYKFDYFSLNPEYNLKAYDRWGNFKPNSGTNCDPLSGGGPSTAEFPYVEQDQANTNSYTSAWSLTDIFLPSGGKIHVDYESDDYAFVQHKKASQMFKIVGTDGPSSGNVYSVSDGGNKNRKVYFELQPGYTNPDDYFGDQTLIYFRCLMETDPIVGDFDYVSGYGEILNKGITTFNSNLVGFIEFKPVKFKDGGGNEFNPISKAAIQFIRMHLSRFAFDQPDISEDDGFGEDVLNAMINSSFAQNIEDAISGPNVAVWNKLKGQRLVANKSWLRLYNPNMKKLGGGCRVSKISMSDEWSGMTGGQMDSYDYGQQYEYTNEDGTSSGVASYEPQIGGDENTFKQPVFFTNDDPTNKFDNLLAPRDDFYQEEPLGESFFPSASVGYGRVTVKNIQRAGVSRTATGKVVHEFFTSKDFPTIVKRTMVEPIHNKNNPFSLAGLFNLTSKDHMTVSQGFVIELNDMNGKPKKQMVYQEGQVVPITEVEYRYESEQLNLDGKLNYRLKNSATVIYPDGHFGNAEIGVFFDMVSDMRQNFTESKGGGLNINADGFLAAILPIVIPIPYPSFSKEETQFRSASTTKVINRFGLLKETIARDLGSIVSTRNLAYDSETGEVLLTQTTTDFNDQIFSLTYPSHWFYDGMGQAYKNINYKRTDLNFSVNGIANITNAHLFFAEGDEVILTENQNLPFQSWSDDYTNADKGWITDVTTTGIKIMKKDGSLVTGGPYAVKVLRSGRRNMQAVPIASITTLKNPLDNFSANIFEKVLQASAMEFSQDWNTFCDCFEDPIEDNFTTNPYVLGTKGNWRMKRSWLHLSPRTQSNFDNNTNIRKDGMFTSYTPFYKLVSNKWNIDERNWTFTSEVTEFSPFGQELENKDALGRFSAATFGFNQSLATAVAANSKYRELGFDSFEDYGFAECFDNHFKFLDNPMIDTLRSHTGRNSIKVSVTSPAVMSKQFENCDVNPCALALSDLNQHTPYLGSVTISGGTAPFNIDQEIVTGNPTFSFNPATGNINIDGHSTNYLMIFTITDQNGCKVIKTIKN